MLDVNIPKQNIVKRVVFATKFESDKVKGSRFIVDISPVQNIDHTKIFLEQIAKQYPDANHHCFAYKFSDGLHRSSDAGEPRGSAGLPILQRIETANLVDTMVIVTRYFGGVKLGVGGLIRAYGSAVSDALVYVQTESVVAATLLSIHGGYPDIPMIQSVIHQFSLEKHSETYTENVQIAVVVLPHMVEKVQRELQERSAGRISGTVCGHISKKL